MHTISFIHIVDASRFLLDCKIGNQASSSNTQKSMGLSAISWIQVKIRKAKDDVEDRKHDELASSSFPININRLR